MLTREDCDYFPDVAVSRHTDFSQAYTWLVQTVMDNGALVYTDHTCRILTKEMNCHIRLEGDSVGQMIRRELPPQYPQQSNEGLNRYIESFETGTDAYRKSAEFEYAYGIRLHERPSLHGSDYVALDQVRHARDEFNGANRQCIMHIWIPEIDMFAKEKPCMQTVQVRDTGEGALVDVLFRSNDAYKAWAWNMSGVISMVHDQIVHPNGGFIRAVDYHGTCAHVYENDFGQARKIRYSPLKLEVKP